MFENEHVCGKNGHVPVAGKPFNAEIEKYVPKPGNDISEYRRRADTDHPQDGRSSFPDLIGLLRLLFFPHLAVMHLVDPRQPVF